jgi:glycosyltransferase involved in cell wall biosynthesis
VRAPRPAAAAFVWHVDLRGRNRRTALRQRIAAVLTALGQPPAAEISTRDLLAALESSLDGAGSDRFWLALSAVGGRLPHHAEVLRAKRIATVEGPLAGLTRVLRGMRPGWPFTRGEWPAVEIVSGETLVDVHHTAQTSFATGIQRVARQSIQRWVRDHEVTLVGWTRTEDGLRRLSTDEQDRALNGGAPRSTPGSRRPATLLIPWGCRYVLPELLADPERTRRLRGLVEFSGSSTGVIGFDCVPLTSAETTALGMTGGFALSLASVASMDRVATISSSAAAEYRGWREMLGGVGRLGPAIEPIPLPVEAGEASAQGLAQARDLMVVGDQPMVLVVGSHEPRKNHLAVLHAAELLWREGLRFSLNFVGGNAWNNDGFTNRLAELQAQGRPVQSISAVTDDLLWAGYRLARCTLFPSFNEGFGLPVAESLGCGTPVITSNFGSMLEIVEDGGGALTVDPRDDHAIADALRSLLTDDDLHARLTAQAQARPVRTWDEYADQTWRYLVEGEVPA